MASGVRNFPEVSLKLWLTHQAAGFQDYTFETKALRKTICTYFVSEVSKTDKCFCFCLTNHSILILSFIAIKYPYHHALQLQSYKSPVKMANSLDEACVCIPGVPPKTEQSIQSIFQDFALINSYLFSPSWIEHLFLIITPRSSNLVENYLFYE